jgi:hypothetical protein
MIVANGTMVDTRAKRTVFTPSSVVTANPYAVPGAIKMSYAPRVYCVLGRTLAGPQSINSRLTSYCRQPRVDAMEQAEVDQLVETGLNVLALANKALERAIGAAREFGATWKQIGASLGVTPQAAQQRWGGVDQLTLSDGPDSAGEVTSARPADHEAP